MMIEMEGSEEGLYEFLWRDMTMSSTGMVPCFGPDCFVNKSVTDMFSGNDLVNNVDRSRFGGNDHVSNVENSTFSGIDHVNDFEVSRFDGNDHVSNVENSTFSGIDHVNDFEVSRFGGNDHVSNVENLAFSGIDHANDFEVSRFGSNDHVSNVENSTFSGNDRVANVENSTFSGDDHVNDFEVSRFGGSDHVSNVKNSTFSCIDHASDFEVWTSVGNDHVLNTEDSTFDAENMSTVESCGSGGLSYSTKDGGRIEERRGGKCGFDNGKITTPWCGIINPLLPSIGVELPYRTIPARISPNVLLDSSVFLPNSQHSRTTGTFAAPSFPRNEEMMIPPLPEDANYSFDGGGLSTMFNGHTDITSLGSFTNVQNQPPGTNVSVSDELPEKKITYMQTDFGTHNYLEDPKKNCTTVSFASTAEDGFNWRKYGQKQVKGSEYHRSYYKCSDPNCEVRKTVEHSHDGQITEIIYKSAHNHSKPQSCRKSQLTDKECCSSSCEKAELETDVKGSPNWRIDDLKRPSSVSVASDLLSTKDKKLLGELESRLAYYDDEENTASPGNILLRDDQKEPDLKRRKKDPSFTETISSRRSSAQKVAVQVESEVDVLDDGYRWRKYGEKVVKGNPNPRSYYKCSSAGCKVRKQLERAVHNLKNVIITYEGKHNHDIPAARNRCHNNSGSRHLRNSAANMNSNPSLTKTPPRPKHEPHSQDLAPPFHAGMGYNNNDLLPFYPLKHATLPSTTSYGYFGSTPDIPMSLPIAFPKSDIDYSYPERTLSSIPPFYAEQQLMDTDVNPIRPKQEQWDESLYHTDMHNVTFHMFNVMGNSRLECFHTFPDLS